MLIPVLPRSISRAGENEQPLNVSGFLFMGNPPDRGAEAGNAVRMRYKKPTQTKGLTSPSLLLVFPDSESPFVRKFRKNILYAYSIKQFCPLYSLVRSF